MIQRWQRLRQNVGTGGAVRTVLAGVFFAVIAFGSAYSALDPTPVIALLLGLLLPTLARRAFVDHFETTAKVLRAAGTVIVGGVLLLGVARGKAWEAGSPQEYWLVPGLTFVVMAYVSAYFWTFSDPEVVRVEA